MTASTPATPRIGLVLGAGGTTGAAFHAGTLLALEQDLGWDPRTADVIVGSSAGSMVGGLLRSGLSTDDLAAWASSATARAEGAASRQLLDELEASPYRIARPNMRLTPWRSMTRPSFGLSEFRPHTALMSVLPGGWIDAGTNLERIGSLVDQWPDQRLWITAVRAADARRIVFGRDPLVATLGQAIAASCAIPALFRPVTIDGCRYIDGGAHSPTNADVLIDAGIDVAVVLSPMSARPGALERRPDHVLRALWARRLRLECRALQRSGIEVQVFQPDAATLRVMGLNALDRKRSREVVARESFLAAGSQLTETASLRRLLGAARNHRQAS